VELAPTPSYLSSTQSGAGRRTASATSAPAGRAWGRRA
jgi:hypothetical protein